MGSHRRKHLELLRELKTSMISPCYPLPSAPWLILKREFDRENTWHGAGAPIVVLHCLVCGDDHNQVLTTEMLGLLKKGNREAESGILHSTRGSKPKCHRARMVYYDQRVAGVMSSRDWLVKHDPWFFRGERPIPEGPQHEDEQVRPHLKHALDAVEPDLLLSCSVCLD